MRLSRTTFALTFTLLIALLISSASFASKADELFAEAKKSVTAAEKATRTSEKNEEYQDAIKSLNEIANDKKYSGMPEGAKALYEMGIIYGTADKRTKTYNLNTSSETFKKLINVYDQPISSLLQNMEKSEAKQVLATVADAKKMRFEVASKLDKQNSNGVLYKIIDSLVKLTGSIPWFSYGFAVILITVVVKVIITPLTKAQFKSMKEMQKIAPLVKELQEKYKGDQKAIGEKTMDLYKEHGVNPFASCLPLLVQMPILMLLFYMINAYKFQFEKGSFLWIGSGLSNMFGFTIPFVPGGKVWLTAGNLAEADLILVVLYVISMYISTKMSAVDPTQAEQQKMMSIVMPLMFAFIFAGYPAAFLLYWLVLNILQTVQQYLIMRAPEPVAAAGSTGGQPTDDSGADRASRSRRRRRR
ncbi:MAG: YidC/Oxa1 family membrane protein insertase [Armatimonadota bacterium]|nr:YidC/Oxa1 family membrane protein insertase [bacterium]